jgi:mRNA interferase RelE/StbE
LRKCDKALAARITNSIEPLQERPITHDTKKVEGSENLLRIRVGDYRILYEIDYGRGLVGIVKIDKRPRAYRGL